MHNDVCVCEELSDGIQQKTAKAKKRAAKYVMYICQTFHYHTVKLLI